MRYGMQKKGTLLTFDFNPVVTSLCDCVSFAVGLAYHFLLLSPLSVFCIVNDCHPKKTYIAVETVVRRSSLCIGKFIFLVFFRFVVVVIHTFCRPNPYHYQSNLFLHARSDDAMNGLCSISFHSPELHCARIFNT